MQFPVADISEILNNIKDISPLISGSKVLVTGCGGFLGQYLLACLAQLNCKVIGVDNFIASDQNTFDYPNFTFYQQDVTQPFSSVITQEKFDFIFACAGVASPAFYYKYPLETISAAIDGTKNCLELAKNTGAKILCFSSSEVYSGSTKMPLTEDDNGDFSTQNARACYDVSKKMLETLCYVYSTKYNTHVTFCRPFNFYGGLLRENDQRVLPSFASQLLRKQPIKIYGKGNQTRTFCYVTDGITGIFRTILLGRKGEGYNLGNPSPEISITQLAHLIEKIIDPTITIEYIPVPENYKTEPQRRVPSIEKAKNELGFSPKVSLEEGLKRFFDWSKGVYFR